MSENLSIKELQELIEGKNVREAGKLLSGENAGNWCGIWYDWFCSDKALPGRAAEFVSYIKALDGEFTKTHYIWLKNNCPMSGGLYDDIRISPFDDSKDDYNIGFSRGNGDTREMQVFDTRGTQGINYHTVKNNKEAAKLVNELLNNNNSKEVN